VAALVLLLLAAWLFVSPLRAFFAQQDRYDRQVVALVQAQAQNKTLRAQIADMHTRDFITREAREQYQLVPADMQAFVVKGLPQDEATPAPSGGAGALESPSLLSRLVDLWHTLSR
jgi:cell division protein FtsB